MVDVFGWNNFGGKKNQTTVGVRQVLIEIFGLPYLHDLGLQSSNQNCFNDFDLNQIIDFQRQLVAMNEFVACEKVKVTAGTIKNNYRAFKLSTTNWK